jgi:hypothetical protein
VYRGEPLEPELYEYFSLPAIFIDYTMQGQGKNNMRLVSLVLHIVVDELPNAANIAPENKEGMKRFLYCLTLQQVLEGQQLGKSTPLKFIVENPVDAPVANYHTHTYEFEMYLDDMAGDDTDYIIGEFERLNIFGKLLSKKNIDK